MPENIIKSNNAGDSAPQPKRKIVRRIVRRVPKRKDDVVPLQAATQTIKRTVSRQTSSDLDDVIANEEPVTPSISNEPIVDTRIDEELDDPKAMILKQLSHGKGKELPKSIVKESPIKPEAMANTWPYVINQKRVIEEDEYEDEEGDSKRYFSWIPWVIIPLIVIGLVIFGLSYFAGAEVTVIPKVAQVHVSSNITTEKDVDQSKAIPLTVLIIEDKASRDTAAEEAKTTIATASGKVTIFNKQKVSQTLIKTTRLEAADGKIYRIRENIKIPAANGDKPGAFDVMVYAESAGPDYNKKTGTDFNIPGFKGKPQFDLVYAKSITDIVGGSSGVKKSISKERMEEVAKDIKIELENKLRARVSRELLNNQVAYEGLYQFNYKDPTLEAADAPEKARVTLIGTLAVPVFDKTLLTRELAKSSVKDYAGEDISINKIDQLTAKVADNQKIDLLTDKKATFNFEGDVKFTWSVDIPSFTKALLNVSKNDIPRVSARFTGIDKTTATINPPWKNYLPGDAKDIKVKIVEPEVAAPTQPEVKIEPEAVGTTSKTTTE